ncbi:MAG: C40 family peptidase [Rubrivivax sp.]
MTSRLRCSSAGARGRLAAALLAACAACASPGVRAAPDAAGGDAVLKLLEDKGLLRAGEAAESNAIVRQVRNAASELVLSAMNFLGVRYRRGGSSAEEGFDCSGFTRYVFENSIGLVLPRRADQQARLAGLLAVRGDDLRPGDLVFFNTMRRAFSHVGIYIGEGKFIHAPRSGAQVRIEDMREAYWTKRYNGARRAESAESAAALAALLPLPPAAAAAAAAAQPSAPPPALPQ